MAAEPPADGRGNGRPLCGASRRGREGRCTRPAGWGTDHPGYGYCKLHGGTTPTHAVAARREQAAEAVVTYGLPREVEPHEALLEELHRTAGHVAWLGGMVRALEAGELHGPVGGGQWAIPREEPHIWVRLYGEERDRLARVARTCVEVGIEERRVRVAEQIGELIAAFGRGLLGEFGIDPASEEARLAVRRQLMLVDGGAGEGDGG